MQGVNGLEFDGETGKGQLSGNTAASTVDLTTSLLSFGIQTNNAVVIDSISSYCVRLSVNKDQVSASDSRRGRPFDTLTMIRGKRNLSRSEISRLLTCCCSIL